MCGRYLSGAHTSGDSGDVTGRIGSSSGSLRAGSGLRSGNGSRAGSIAADDSGAWRRVSGVSGNLETLEEVTISEKT